MSLDQNSEAAKIFKPRPTQMSAEMVGCQFCKTLFPVETFRRFVLKEGRAGATSVPCPVCGRGGPEDKEPRIIRASQSPVKISGQVPQ